MSTPSGEREGVGLSQATGSEGAPNQEDRERRELKRNCLIRVAKRDLLLTKLASVDRALESGEKLQLQQLNLTLFEGLNELQKIDQRILELSIQLDENADIAQEMSEASQIRADIQTGLLKIEVALNPHAANSQPSPTQNKGNIPSKLPKLQLQRFSGDPKDWQRFWDIFERNIHKNDNLEPIDKFDYLTGLLHGQAAKAIEGLEINARNYDEAVDKLKSRFGRKSLITQNHIRNLSDIQPVFNEKDVQRLRKFHDEIEVNHRALRSLGVDQATYSCVIVPALLKKLPEQIKLLITRGRDNYEDWDMDTFLKMLLQEIELREVHGATSEKSKDFRPRNVRQEPTTGSALVTRDKLDCAFCRGDHLHEKCTKVVDIEKRKELIKRYGRCFKCMKKGHKAHDCRVRIKCANCNGGHHTSICRDGKGSDKNEEERVVAPSLHVGSQGKVALQTLQADAWVDGQGPKVRCRVMLDSGSQCTFVTSELAELMKAKPKERKWLKLDTFGQSNKAQKCNVYTIKLAHVDGGREVQIDVFEVPSITSLANVHPEVIKENYEHLKELQFSDVSAKEELVVHLLVGADNLWRLQKENTRRGEKAEPVAVETVLGWTLSGPVGESKSKVMHSNVNLILGTPQDAIDQKLNQLWDFESIGITEAKDVHEEFQEQIEFKGDRYSVKLPWKEEKALLPTNYNLSLARLKGQIKKLQKDEKTAKEYDRVIKEQLEEGIIEKVTDENETKEGTHYLPHHPVIREQAETTKLRVVFDASAKVSKSKLSLNDCLHTGPSLAPMLYDVLLRLREHKVVLIGDIRKAFLQIEIDVEDRNSLRFLWVKDILAKQPEIEVYQFCRVIFGAGPSPFLLNATLRHHLQKYEEEEPEFVKKVKDSLYIDDLVSGTSTVEEAFDLFKRAKDRLRAGGFLMHKWKSNDNKLLEAIKVETKEVKESTEQEVTYAKESLGTNINEEEDKVLGVKWNRVEDNLVYDFKETIERAESLEPTKRNILSIIASMFDPLGLVSPILVSAKILLQELCKSKIGWDETPEERIIQSWRKWLIDLKTTREILFPRCVYPSLKEVVQEISIHGFADASSKAYCAAVYLLCKQESVTRAQLLTSKTRVAPLKEQSIPRLELTSARILARLVETVKKALENQVQIRNTTLWLDSTTALLWIKNVGEWKPFVQNRVKEILRLTSRNDWRYCPTGCNPADIGSRGIKASKLKDNQLWREGPDWLATNQWPNEMPNATPEETEQERIKVVQANVVTREEEKQVDISSVIDVKRYSKETKLYRVTACVLRFIDNLKASLSKANRADGELTTEEIRRAKRLWIMTAQKEFDNDPNFASTKQNLGVQSVEGIMRCHGRLSNAELPEEAKVPILLPREHQLTRLIIQASHERVFHGGVRPTLAEVRSVYWICKGRSKVKQVIRDCERCKREKAKGYAGAPTASLPEFRVRPARPFSQTGLDFAGPLYFKTIDGMKKSYVVLFTCAVTRAVHLELVPDQAVPTFIQALRRFSARRGMPERIQSDNAQTFKATAKWLKRLQKTKEVRRFLQERNCVWKFNLPLSPWWGGFWERLVGSVKSCLRKVLGQAKLRFSELETLLFEVECAINNRPMTYEYEEIGHEMLTPAHLLYGYRLCSMPDDVQPNEAKDDVTRRAKYMTTLRKQLWDRWSKEYLLNLREHHRVHKGSRKEVSIGDVVILNETGKPRSQWRLGKIVKLLTGKDGYTRGVELEVADKKGQRKRLQRPLQLLYSLEIKEQRSDPEADHEEQAGTTEEKRARPRRAAAMDADWRRRLMTEDQSS